MASQYTFDHFTGKNCHGTTDCSTTGLYWIDFLDPQEREVILWRDGLSMINVDTILCHHHNYILSKRFVMKQRSCWNPLGFHSTTRKGNSFYVLQAIFVNLVRYKCSMKSLYEPLETKMKFSKIYTSNSIYKIWCESKWIVMKCVKSMKCCAVFNINTKFWCSCIGTCKSPLSMIIIIQWHTHMLRVPSQRVCEEKQEHKTRL